MSQESDTATVETPAEAKPSEADANDKAMLDTFSKMLGQDQARSSDVEGGISLPEEVEQSLSGEAPSDGGDDDTEVAGDTEVAESPHEDADEAGDSVVEESKKKKPKSKDGAEAETKARLEKARDALKKWQWPDELLNSLEQQDPDEFIRRGEAAANSQANANRVANERAELRKQVEQVLAERTGNQEALMGDADQNAADEAGKTNDKSVQESVAELLAPLREDDLYSDLADTLDKVFGLLASNAGPSPEADTSRYDTQLQEQRRLIEAMSFQNDELMLAIAKRELLDDFPALSDPDKYKKVVDRVYQFADLPGYSSEDGKPDINKLMRDAAMIEIGRDQENQSRTARARRYREQTNGQPSDSGKPSGNAIAELDNEQKMLYAFRALQSGKKKEDVIKALRR